MKKRIFAALLAIVSFSAVGGELTNKYVELISAKKVDSFSSPYGAPQVFEETIDTAGFSEIRMFVNVSVEDYEKHPVTKKTMIHATLFHTVTNGSSHDYSRKEIRSEVASYVSGWFSEKIIGNKTRVLALANDFPKGPYTVTVTYYLVR